MLSASLVRMQVPGLIPQYDASRQEEMDDLWVAGVSGVQTEHPKTLRPTNHEPPSTKATVQKKGWKERNQAFVHFCDEGAELEHVMRTTVIFQQVA